MKLALIEITCPDIRGYGVRCLSSHLKSNGHDVRLLFLPPGMESLRHEDGVVPDFDEAVIDQVIDLLKDRDMVGVSFMTYYFWRAIQLSEQVRRRLKIPVIAGGVHATVRTEECLEHFDIVAQGESEETLVELCDAMDAGKDPTTTAGFWFKDGKGNTVRNPIGRLVPDIERLGYPDWSLDDHYAYMEPTRQVEKLDKEKMKYFFQDGPLQPMGEFYHYKTMGSRGCPHNCSYCCVSTYREKYDNKRYLRWRPMDNFIEELVRIRKQFPYINAFGFFDDAFFSVSVSRLKKFCDLYKDKVGLPFAVQTSPSTTTPEKMELVYDAGMRYIEMGIQTGSERIKERYDRKVPNDRVIAAARYISAYKGRILPPDYHLMLDNPWETPADAKATLDLLLALPRPFNLKPSSLVLYPGTGVHDQAIAEGIITDEKAQVYRKAFGAPHATWLNYLILMAGNPMMPRGLIRFLSRDFFIRTLQKDRYRGAIAALRGASELFFRVLRAGGMLLRGDFGRFSRKLSRRRAVEHAG